MAFIAYELFTLLDWILISVAPIFLIPTLTLANNYKKIGARDYLLLASVFFFTLIHFPIFSIFNIYIQDGSNVDENLITFIWIIDSIIGTSLRLFFLILITIGFRYEVLDGKTKKITIFAILGNCLLQSIALLTRSFVDFETFIFIGFIASFYTTLLGVFVYYKFRQAIYEFDLELSNQRSNSALRLWKIHATLSFVAWVLAFFGNILVIVGGPIFIFFLPVTVLSIISPGILAVLAIRYPEALLLSHSQILNATKLYELAEKDSIQGDYHPLIQYISELPFDLLKQE